MDINYIVRLTCSISTHHTFVRSLHRFLCRLHGLTDFGRCGLPLSPGRKGKWHSYMNEDKRLGILYQGNESNIIHTWGALRRMSIFKYHKLYSFFSIPSTIESQVHLQSLQSINDLIGGHTGLHAYMAWISFLIGRNVHHILCRILRGKASYGKDDYAIDLYIKSFKITILVKSSQAILLPQSIPKVKHNNEREFPVSRGYLFKAVLFTIRS